MKVNITSVLKTVEMVADTLDKLDDNRDYRAMQIYMEGLDDRLAILDDDDFEIIEDREWKYITNVRPYIKAIERIRYYDKNGKLSPYVETLLDALEEFLY